MSPPRRPPTETWLAHLDELIEHVQTTGRWPRSTCHDRLESRLGHWLSKQRQLRRKGALCLENMALLDQKAPGWWESGQMAADNNWDATLQDVVSFTRRNGQSPRIRRNRPTEAKSGYWLFAQRHAYRQGTLSASRISALDDQLPTWRARIEPPPSFNERLRQTLTFQNEHGYWPRREGDDEEETVLGHWLSNTIYATQRQPTRLTQHQLAQLDEHIPGWQDGSYRNRRDHVFNTRLAELAEFIKRHQRLPAAASREPELGLYRWLDRQRVNPDLDTHRAAALDEIAAGWRQGRRSAAWVDHLDKLVEFYAHHGRLPSHREPQDAAARSLANWLTRQRQRVNQDPEGFAHLRRILDHSIPQWITTTHEDPIHSRDPQTA